jgi:hypothetical protein
LLAALLESAPARSAPAAKAQAVLEWTRDEGAEGCVEQRALERAVEARLRRPVFSEPAAADLLVRGRASTNQDGYVVRLALSTRDGRKLGSREVTTRAPHCSALDDSLALVVAIMVDGPREQAQPVGQSARGAAPAYETVERRNGTSRLLLPQRTYAPREPWRASGALLGVASWGLVPDITPGLRVRAGVEPPAFWWVEMDAAYFLDSEAEIEGGGARFSLLSAGVWLCPLAWETRSIRAGACAGQILSRLKATGFGFDENRSQTRLLYDVGIRGSVWWRLLPPFAVNVGFVAAVPLVRDSFVLSRRPGGPEELFRPGVLTFTGEAGVGVELP